MDSVVSDEGAGTPALAIGQPAPAQIRVIDRMRAAFMQRSWLHQIPEYPDADGKPLDMYFLPLTSADVDAAMIGVPDGQVLTPRERDVRTLITKARDAQGRLLFAAGDLVFLMTEVPFLIINRATQFMYTVATISVDEAKAELGNEPKSAGSSGTPENATGPSRTPSTEFAAP